MAPLMEALGARFQDAHPGVRIDVQSVGSSRGVGDARAGVADLGMVARPLRPDEGSLHTFVLARDGVAVVLPRTSPVASLTDAQVVGLFTRSVINWKDMGGPDAPVWVVSVADNNPLAEVFLAYYKLKAGQVRANEVATDSRDLLEKVARRPDAVGYAALSALAGSSLPVVALSAGGISGTAANLANGTYPLVLPLLLVSREAPQGPVQQLLEFTRSPAARELIENHHFVVPAK